GHTLVSRISGRGSSLFGIACPQYRWILVSARPRATAAEPDPELDASDSKLNDSSHHWSRIWRQELTDEAFCLAGLLIAGKSLDRVARLLPPGRREAVSRLTQELSALPAHELQRRLSALRESAVLQVNARLSQAFGPGWRELPPLLQSWLGEAVLETHGNEN